MCFEKKYLYLQYRKKQLKHPIMEKLLKYTIMEKQIKRSIKNPMVQNYRITVVFKDEVIRVKFNTKELAKSTIEKFKELYPELYLSGAIEEKRKRWEVTWVLV